MKLFYFLIILVGVSYTYNCYAQRNNRNWVFGTNAGIEFLDSDSARPFKTEAETWETTGCISDSTGKLLFYFTNTDDWNLSNILDGNGNLSIITGADSINIYDSNSSGPIILPSYDNNRYLIFHTKYDIDTECTHPFCPKLLLSVVKYENDILSIEKKNVPLLDKPLFEKMAAVKHANGKDWWVVVYTDDTAGTTVNRFYKFLVVDTAVNGPYFQDVGQIDGDDFDTFGQMKYSKNGSYLGLAYYGTASFDIYSFDRCNGYLTSHITRKYTNINDGIYGLEFSPNEKLIYISSGTSNFSGGSKLFQIDLSHPNQVQQVGYNPKNFAQLQLAVNDKIYVANQCGPGAYEITYSSCNQYLSVINQPDSAGNLCDFQLYSLYLGDSSKSTFSLPNMPNYNLGPLSIYQANAGTDKTWCIEDTLVKGFFLGIPEVSGVIYSWYPSDSLSDVTSARPFASPTQTTMYIVTLTDTSIKYSCQSREDTVWVIVKDCTVGMEEPGKENEINIFPNPANEILFVSTANQSIEIHHIIISDISGKEIIRTSQTAIPVAALLKGLYFVEIRLNGGHRVVKKVMIG